jgi:hypothetical protein
VIRLVPAPLRRHTLRHFGTLRLRPFDVCPFDVPLRRAPSTTAKGLDFAGLRTPPTSPLRWYKVLRVPHALRGALEPAWPRWQGDPVVDFALTKRSGEILASILGDNVNIIHASRGTAEYRGVLPSAVEYL